MACFVISMNIFLILKLLTVHGIIDHDNIIWLKLRNFYNTPRMRLNLQ